MKTRIILTFLASVCILFLSACAGGRISNVNSVTLDGNIPKAGRMGLTNQASANVDSFATPGMGILPMLVLGAVHQGVVSKPRKAIEDAVAAHSIAIEKIVPAAFADEIARSGSTKLVTTGGADGTLHFIKLNYGLVHQGGAWTSSALAATVAVVMNLDCTDGRHFKSILAFGMSPKDHWHTQEEYRDHPELLRAGWEEASRMAARVVLYRLQGGKVRGVPQAGGVVIAPGVPPPLHPLPPPRAPMTARL